MTVELLRLRPADAVAVHREAFGAAPCFEGEAEVARFATDALPLHPERRGRVTCARWRGRTGARPCC